MKSGQARRLTNLLWGFCSEVGQASRLSEITYFQIKRSWSWKATNDYENGVTPTPAPDRGGFFGKLLCARTIGSD
jgi:hypothetical protein